MNKFVLGIVAVLIMLVIAIISNYNNLVVMNENVSGKWNTIPEINKLPNLHLSIILSDYGKNYPYNKITLTNKNIISLGGNHHFNRNYQKVTSTIIKQLK